MFSSNVTMMFYFDIFFILLFSNPAFCRLLKSLGLVLVITIGLLNFFSITLQQCCLSFIQSQKKQHSLEIWAVKLRFLLIYENMLKSITTARSECTAKHENKASYSTDHIVPDVIEYFGDD